MEVYLNMLELYRTNNQEVASSSESLNSNPSSGCIMLSALPDLYSIFLQISHFFYQSYMEAAAAASYSTAWERLHKENLVITLRLCEVASACNPLYQISI